MSADAGSVSFAQDIQPLFREGDRQAMKFPSYSPTRDAQRHSPPSPGTAQG
jgi:hypothetical protein